SRPDVPPIVVTSGGGATRCAVPGSVLVICVLVTFFKSGAGATGSTVPRSAIAWVAETGNFGSGFTACGAGAIFRLARFAAPLVSTGGATTDGCGNAGM